MKKTRYNLIGYKCEAPYQWSFYDLSTQGSIGPKYYSASELLADLDRFVKERGYDQIGNRS